MTEKSCLFQQDVIIFIRRDYLLNLTLKLFSHVKYVLCCFRFSSFVFIQASKIKKNNCSSSSYSLLFVHLTIEEKEFPTKKTTAISNKFNHWKLCCWKFSLHQPRPMTYLIRKISKSWLFTRWQMTVETRSVNRRLTLYVGINGFIMFFSMNFYLNVCWLFSDRIKWLRNVSTKTYSSVDMIKIFLLINIQRIMKSLISMNHFLEQTWRYFSRFFIQPWSSVWWLILIVACASVLSFRLILTLIEFRVKVEFCDWR